jgi:hypothetical protein
MHISQPPTSLPDDLRKYLTLLITEINTALINTGSTPKVLNKLPAKPSREIYGFDAAIGTTIPSAGLYYYNGTTWQKII